MENKKLSFDEIIKIVEENGVSIESFARNYYKSIELGLGKVKRIKAVSNSDEVYYVNYFIEHDIYVKTQGYYDSYDSYETFEDAESYGFEVKPIEKVVTFYE